VQPYDGTPEEYLAKLRPRRMVRLPCPDCPHVINGLTGDHARALLAIHQEGTCQGPGEVNSE
jgi:hypothetical protein